MDTSKYFTAERARAAREFYEEERKQLEFKEAAELEPFNDILEEIKLAANAGKTSIEFLPHSEQFYLQKLQNDGQITSEDADFSDDEVRAYFALRQLGYTVNVITAKQATGNSGVVLPGMNPMQGGLNIAHCKILWG